MSRLRFVKVSGQELIESTAALAEEIWREHYTPFIGKAQVDYMLARFQSPDALRAQIEHEGYHYFLFQNDAGHFIGYLGYVLTDRALFLSKIYLRSQDRGRGYARQAIAFLEVIAKRSACSKITLTVNKNNSGSICAYEKLGFVKAASIVQDIGNGYVMDDYRMEKALEL